MPIMQAYDKHVEEKWGCTLKDGLKYPLKLTNQRNYSFSEKYTARRSYRYFISQLVFALCLR